MKSPACHQRRMSVTRAGSARDWCWYRPMPRSISRPEFPRAFFSNVLAASMEQVEPAHTRCPAGRPESRGRRPTEIWCAPDWACSNAASARTALDRYTAPNENSVPVAAIGSEPYSGPRRAERARKRQSTSQGLRVSWGIKGGSPWLVGGSIRRWELKGAVTDRARRVHW